MAGTLAGPGAHVVRRFQFVRVSFMTEGERAVDRLASRPMTARRQRLGGLAEELVAKRLGAAGWELVERNARTRYGEIDLVALDGRALVFVEVKASRAGTAFGPERPVLAVTRDKQRRLRRLATAWMAQRRDLPRYEEIRFDAVGVTFDRGGHIVDYEHIRGAF
jgi:putative endonuclease